MFKGEYNRQALLKYCTVKCCYFMQTLSFLEVAYLIQDTLYNLLMHFKFSVTWLQTLFKTKTQKKFFLSGKL